MAELETVTVSGLPNAATPLTGSERVLLDQATGSVLAASALVAGKAYRIEVVGTTNWLACGVPSGVTPAVGLTFQATAPESGTGTAIEVRTVDAPVQAIVDLAGTGTVTSVALSAPTGFGVSGTPVTTAGTLALSFSPGYSLPTDSRQEDWDAAFTQRRTWDGGNQHLNAANGRASLQLGSAAQAATTDFATAAQGGKADTAIQPGTLTAALASKADLIGGLVPSSQLPGFVDDVLEFASLAAFPATGETGKIYVSLATGRIYRWSGSIYIELVGSPGSTDAVPEGSVNLYFTTLRGQTAASSWWASYASSVGQALVTAGDGAAARNAISAEQAGAAAAAVSAHAAATDPHPAYALESSLGSAAQSPASDFVSATATRAANLVFAGPTSGAAAAPTFRALVAADLPAIQFIDLAYTATINIDFAAYNNRLIVIGTLTGNLSITFSNIVRGCQVTVILTSDGSNRTITYPGSTPFVGAKQTLLLANKIMIAGFTVYSSGGNDAAVLATSALQQ